MQVIYVLNNVRPEFHQGIRDFYVVREGSMRTFNRISSLLASITLSTQPLNAILSGLFMADE